MYKKFVSLILIALFLFIGLACGKQPVPATEVPAKPVIEAPAKLAWQVEWEKTLTEAKKEGVVSIYSLWRPETRTSLTAAFKEKYDLSLEFSPFARGDELLAKVQREQRAGLYTADVYGAGAATLVASMKPENVLGPIEPLLILPETIDPKSWSGGKFPFMDKDRLCIGFIAMMQRFLVYNTDLVKKGEITNYKDILKPQYKGKITMNDPSVTGVGSSLLAHLSLHIWNLEESKEYLRQLIKQQEVVIQRDNRIHVESVARAKYAIALAPMPDIVAEFIKLGAPIDAVIIPEGTAVLSSAGAIAVPPRQAHPHAARIFVNWLLGKEGQTVFAKSFGNPSLRSDVSTEGFHPLFLAQPGEKLFLDSEEFILFRGTIPPLAKQIMDELSK